MIVNLSELSLVVRENEVSAIIPLVGELMQDTNCDLTLNHYHEGGHDLVMLTVESVHPDILKGIAKYLEELE